MEESLVKFLNKGVIKLDAILVVKINIIIINDDKDEYFR